MSMGFNNLHKYLKVIMMYCDNLREIKPKREQVKSLESELEQSINALQLLNIEQNELEMRLNETQQQHVQATNDKHSLQACIHETETKLVQVISRYYQFQFYTRELIWMCWMGWMVVRVKDEWFEAMYVDLR